MTISQIFFFPISRNMQRGEPHIEWDTVMMHFLISICHTLAVYAETCRRWVVRKVHITLWYIYMHTNRIFKLVWPSHSTVSPKGFYQIRLQCAPRPATDAPLSSGRGQWPHTLYEGTACFTGIYLLGWYMLTLIISILIIIISSGNCDITGT